jgi:hypothetical protein
MVMFQDVCCGGCFQRRYIGGQVFRLNGIAFKSCYMLRNPNLSIVDVADALRYFSECSDTEVVEAIHHLRAQQKLSSTVRALNRLLSEPAHSSDALFVLRRMGLEYGG